MECSLFISHIKLTVHDFLGLKRISLLDVGAHEMSMRSLDMHMHMVYSRCVGAHGMVMADVGKYFFSGKGRA